MNLCFYRSHFSTPIVLLAGALLLSGGASAASQCKGMAQDACAASGECLWIDGYTRKDGRAVSSHCKTRPQRKMDDRAALRSEKLGQNR